MRSGASDDCRVSTVYAESSAVVAWLLGQPGGDDVAAELQGAKTVIASDLTWIECERALIRAWSNGVMSEAERVDRSAALALVAGNWTRLRIDEDVVERARRPFPIEPVRTLEALHLACALVARSAAPDLRLLTLDQRVRENGERLGLKAVPQ
jgi:predicted nucleic acid-binding protein